MWPGLKEIPQIPSVVVVVLTLVNVTEAKYISWAQSVDADQRTQGNACGKWDQEKTPNVLRQNRYWTRRIVDVIPSASVQLDTNRLEL